MKKLSVLTVAFLLFGGITCSSQAKGVELKDIVDGVYGQKSIEEFRSMADGEHYLKANDSKSMIIKYAYKTGRSVDTLFNAQKAKNCPFKTFDGYILSDDETKIMFYTDKESIYRRTFKANYYTFEIRRNLVKPLSENGKQQAALFSPNGRYVAFVRDNNIFLKKLDFDSESAVTTDGALNKIINGVPDWVYEEEFGMNAAMAWSSDNESLAYIRFDETQVPEFSMQMYGGKCPVKNKYEIYPGSYNYKYPVAGERNADVAVMTFNVKSRVIKKMDVPLEAEGYIPRIRFTQNADQLAVITMNRHQSRMRMYFANPKSAICKLIVEDESETWIDQGNMDFITFYPDFFVFASGKSGYRHLYQYSYTGTMMRQLTRGNWEVTQFMGYDAPTRSFYYQSTEESPLCRTMYKLDAKGNRVKLSSKKGTNKGVFSANFKYLQNYFNDTQTPMLITINDQTGRELRVLQDNAALKGKLANITLPKKEFFKFENASGTELNGYILKPVNYQAGKKYPVLMVQYSGPGSQQVLDKWSLDWEQYLASNGYVIACVDGRGTGNRGEEFEKCIYKQLGYLESQDQIAAAKHMASLPFVDKNRIAIWGWSFGGYTTLMSMTWSENVYKAGIAVAPVTDWRFYDSIYTERYMRTPKENYDGYQKTSPLVSAAKMSGELLLVHGTADDNVHYTNTLEYSAALIESNKQFDMQVYTNYDHSIKGCNARLHLYTKMFNFLQKNL